MSNDKNDTLAVRAGALTKSLNKSIKSGSLTDLIRVQQFDSIALLLDCSGSMSSTMENGKQRITGLREAVREVQSARGDSPLKMVQFGSGWEPSYCLTIPNPEGGTPLDRAIVFATTEKFGRAVVISDGVPDSQERALQAAENFKGRIDVIFVGDPGEPGERFLKRLAELTGGEQFTGSLSDPKMIAGKVMGMLEAGSPIALAESDEE